MSTRITRPIDVLETAIPFHHGELTLCVAAFSKLLRTKIRHALANHSVQLFETEDLQQLTQFVENFQPRLVFLGFRFFCDPDFPGPLIEKPPGQRPRFILVGTQQELDSDIRCKGIDALLCTPFFSDMVLLKINSVLDPNRSWTTEHDLVLRKMRKYQRFEVHSATMVILSPIHERTKVVDFSYQGLKVETQFLTSDQVDQFFKIQLNCEGATIILEARLMWVRQSQAGFRFRKDRPPGFADFFRRVVSQADATD